MQKFVFSRFQEIYISTGLRFLFVKSRGNTCHSGVPSFVPMQLARFYMRIKKRFINVGAIYLSELVQNALFPWHTKIKGSYHWRFEACSAIHRHGEPGSQQVGSPKNAV
ncbi:hypothetical protein ANAPC5_01144 [Anaplasma phagocytophilum]|nr:hypothetical protein ANAPC5_01144 [Anaplasma phagocytophilum]